MTATSELHVNTCQICCFMQNIKSFLLKFVKVKLKGSEIISIDSAK